MSAHLCRLSLHSWSGLVLLCLVLWQKQVVLWMAASGPSWRELRAIHSRIGYATLIAIACMVTGGFVSGGYSAFENFSTFNVGPGAIVHGCTKA